MQTDYDCTQKRGTPEFGLPFPALVFDDFGTEGGDFIGVDGDPLTSRAVFVVAKHKPGNALKGSTGARISNQAPGSLLEADWGGANATPIHNRVARAHFRDVRRAEIKVSPYHVVGSAGYLVATRHMWAPAEYRRADGHTGSSPSNGHVLQIGVRDRRC